MRENAARYVSALQTLGELVGTITRAFSRDGNSKSHVKNEWGHLRLIVAAHTAAFQFRPLVRGRGRRSATSPTWFKPRLDDPPLSVRASSVFLRVHPCLMTGSEWKPMKERKPSAPTLARYRAAGRLHTTPTEYAKFLIEAIDPKPSDTFRINSKSLKEMVRPQVKITDSSSWALGWQIQHTKNGDLIQHGGKNPGYQCFISASVERRSGVVIMTNGHNGAKWIGPIFEQVIERYLVG
jgi:hypothetical protein